MKGRLPGHLPDDGFGKTRCFARNAIFHLRRVTTLLPSPLLTVRVTSRSTSGRQSNLTPSSTITRSAPFNAESWSVSTGTLYSRAALLKLMRSLLSYTLINLSLRKRDNKGKREDETNENGRAERKSLSLKSLTGTSTMEFIRLTFSPFNERREIHGMFAIRRID